MRPLARCAVWGLILAWMVPSNAARGGPVGGSLLEYVRGRDDLSPGERATWEKAIRRRFGGAALDEESETRVEVSVAKAIIASAIFMRVSPERAVAAAREGWHGALGYVPPPIAIEYQILALQGRKPRGRPIDLAFDFPEYYNEEIAPDVVAYWEESLAAGKVPEDARAETIEALRATRVKMRPLLVDKLRLIARLGREQETAAADRRAEIDRDLRELQSELERSFRGVAADPEVLDSKRAPFERLFRQLEAMGLPISPADRELEPVGGTPRQVPDRRSDAPDRRSQVVERSPETELPKELPKEIDRRATARSRDERAAVGDREAPGDRAVARQDTKGATNRPAKQAAKAPTEGGSSPSAGAKEKGLPEIVASYRDQLVTTVKPWLGTPYRFGAALRGVGTDCSGFSRGVADEGFGVPLPRVSRDQFRVGMSVGTNDLRPGDLVFFDTLEAGRVTHVGVYAGQGRFAHASSSEGVVYAELGVPYFQRAYRGARRILSYPSVE